MANTLGTITPTLVAQEALELLSAQFPLLSAFTTDFSKESVLYGQTVYSRIPTVQAVQDFDTTNGYVASTGTLTDVPVTINKHRHTSVAFSDQELSSTNLNLIQQFATPLAFALGNDVMASVAALFITGTYSNPAPIAGVATATRVNSILAAKKALDTAGVPQNDRFFINSPSSELELLSDASLVQSLYNVANSTANAGLPKTHGFGFGTYTSLPSTSSMIAVALQKNAVVIAARAPELPSANSSVMIPGNITNVTDPRTGLTIQIRESYDMVKAKMQVTYAIQYGVAVGSAKNAVIITR